MEVHAHTHTPRKKWTHYFWEFLMLFLAVFCGFLAENYREHRIEQRREKKYIESMIADLKNDTAAFTQAIAINKRSCDSLDTLIFLLKAKDRAIKGRRIYRLSRFTPLDDPFLTCHDKTYEQLKHSGGLRLIHNAATLDQVSDYYQANKFIEGGPSPMQYQNRRDYILSVDKLFDAGTMQELMRNYGGDSVYIPEEHFKLLTEDPATLNLFCTRMHFMYSTKKVVSTWAQKFVDQAVALLKRLEEEYHLD